MNTVYRYGVSVVAACSAFVAANIDKFLYHGCDDCLVRYGVPFTFPEEGSGWGFSVRRVVWVGAAADLVVLLIVSAAIAISWNRLPRLLGVAFASLSALCAIGAGSGAAVLITHTYNVLKYSVSYTVLCAAASVLLFHAARGRWWLQTDRLGI